jgi:Tol biopolymer transport system component
MDDRDRLRWGPDDDARISHAELESELGAVVARGRHRRARRTAVVGSTLAVAAVLAAAVALRGPGDSSGLRAADDPSTTVTSSTLLPTTSTSPSTTVAPAPRPTFVVVSRNGDFEAAPDGQTFHGRIDVLDGSSGKLLRTVHRSVFNIGGVSLSPDGKHVYFVHSDCGTSSVLQVRVDGPSDQTPEAMSESESDYPTVSADGRRLAYLGLGACDENPAWELRVKDLATGKEEAVATQPRGHSLTSPTWSPDGARLAVTVHAVDDSFVAVLDPTRHQNVLAAPRVTSPRQGFRFHSPTYLPDGSLFVVESEQGEPHGSTESLMLVVDPRTGETIRRVATGDPKRSYKSTASDATGRHLLYVSVGETSSELRVSSNGARTVVLATDVTAADW